MTDAKPYIFKLKTKIDSSGQEIEKFQLTVQGDSLKECRKHFDELWDDKNED